MPDQPDLDLSSTPVLDPSVLDRMAADVGGLGTVAAVADVYLAQLGARLDELRASREGDPATLRRTAHSLKSASAVLGLRRMAELCLRLELSAESDPAQATALVDAVTDASVDAERELAAWRTTV